MAGHAGRSDVRHDSEAGESREPCRPSRSPSPSPEPDRGAAEAGKGGGGGEEEEEEEEEEVVVVVSPSDSSDMWHDSEAGKTPASSLALAQACAG